MAIDTSSLSQLIKDFRSIQTRNSITPDSLGYLLQQIVDLLSTFDEVTGSLSPELASQISSLRTEFDEVQKQWKTSLKTLAQDLQAEYDDLAKGYADHLSAANEAHDSLTAQINQLLEANENLSEQIKQLKVSAGITPQFSGIFIKERWEPESIPTTSTALDPDDNLRDVVYSPKHKCFLLRVRTKDWEPTASGMVPADYDESYYNNWGGAPQAGFIFEDMAYRPIPGIEHQATKHPYGRYIFAADGSYSVVPMTRIGSSENEINQ